MPVDKCVVADWQQQPASKAGSRPAAKREPEMMDKTLETTGTPRPWRYHAIGKTLGEDALAAANSIALKPTNMGNKPD